MENSLIAQPLAAREVMLAYPLVRAGFPRLLPQQWRRFATPLTRTSPSGLKKPRGVITLRNGTGHMVALFVYRVESGLEVARVLTCSNCVVTEWVPGHDVTPAMARVAANLAREFDCGSVRLEVENRSPQGWNWMRTFLETAHTTHSH